MEVGDAVRAAKKYIIDLYNDESPENIGLEEVEYDESDNVWVVGIGFSRPWQMSRAGGIAGLPPFRPGRSERDYKTVRISGVNGQLLSVKNREVPG